jgi:hypothetical protein
MFQKYVSFVYITALILNLYKFIPMMMVKLGYEDNYFVFPWMAEGIRQKSNSSPDWLMFHLFTALLHVMTTAATLYPQHLFDPVTLLRNVTFNTKNEVHEMVRTLLFWVFHIQILMNCWNFGTATFLVAVGINAGLSLVSFYIATTNRFQIYFTLITTPIMLEFLTLVKTMITCLF